VLRTKLTDCIIAVVLTICCLFPALAAASEVSSAPTIIAQDSLSKQTAMTEAPVEFNKDYFKGYVTDFSNMVTSPSRWDSSDWLTTAAVTGAALVLYSNDAYIQKWVLDHKTASRSDIGDKVTYLGSGKFTPALLGGMYLYGHFADDGKMRKTVLLSAESFVLSGVFTQVLKYGTGRHRPYMDDGPNAWSGPSFSGSGSTMSFPSGHAQTAFSIATVIASEYDNYVVPALAYGVATITALNRVQRNAHWSSDIFVGSTIGYFTGKAVVAAHRGTTPSRISFTPIIDNRDMGMMVTYRFN